MTSVPSATMADLTPNNNPPPPPTKFCDIVMEGGITSGIVYPLAVCELANSYRFKGIGGTSAGAIAAAATAAAELGRTKRANNFAKLKELPTLLGAKVDSQWAKRFALLPDWLHKKIAGNQTTLSALFQPEAETRPLFNTLVAFLGDPQGIAWRVLRAALCNFPLASILGALPGLLLAWLVIQTGSWPLIIWGGLGSLILTAVGIIVLIGWQACKVISQEIPANFYGLCSGFAPPTPGQPPALTVWLADYLDDLAGQENFAKPLTFGDLWGDDPQERQINLQMISTNLTHGRPYTLPFGLYPNQELEEEEAGEQETGTEQAHRRLYPVDEYFFDPEEFRKLFPEKIVAWMCANPARPPRETDPQANGRLLPILPLAANLPVTVATRMSLAFPFLLSAVPLYAIDFSRDVNQKIRQHNYRKAKEPNNTEPWLPYEAGKCWFSDGGITSNFPVHFFDRPLPRWPTFAINLRLPHHDRQVDKEEPSKNIWMPKTNHYQNDFFEWWNYFDKKPGMYRVSGFGWAIFDAARTWMDNTQLRVPGYRDRVVHITVADTEGGLNLNMLPKDIQNLSERGQWAGKELVSRFADPNTLHQLSWANHRWVRYRSTMAIIQEALKSLFSRYQDSNDDELSYAALIKRDQDTLPKSYRWQNQQQQQFAQEVTETLQQLAKKLGEAELSFTNKDPKPRPELRIRPRI